MYINTILSLLALLVAFVTQSAGFAGSSTFATVEGTVMSANSNKIQLALESGKQVFVARGAIPQYYSLSPGSKVVAYFTQKEFLASLKKGR